MQKALAKLIKLLARLYIYPKVQGRKWEENR